MKKLNLQLGSIKEMLSKEQMKRVIGGHDYGGVEHYDCQCLTNYSTFSCVDTGDCFSQAENTCGSSQPEDYFCGPKHTA